MNSEKPNPDSRERLQKILARAGVASRRQVEELIREGRVTLNGHVAELGDRANLLEDHVRVDGKLISAQHRPDLYILLHEPRAVVSTLEDPEDRKTILDLVPKRLHKGLVSVGRLDYDSEGLLLLTTDGDFAHRVAHPRFGCVKTYEVKVKGSPKPGDIDRLRQGIVLDGRPTAPARITAFTGPEGLRDSSANSWWRVAIGEGRTRQIREMFSRIGHQVQRLRRVAVGPVSDPHLPKGEWRHLTPEEVENLSSGSKNAPTLTRGRRVRVARPTKGKDGAKGKGRGKSAKPGSRGADSKGAISKGPGSQGGPKKSGPKGSGAKGGGRTTVKKGKRPGGASGRGPKRTGRGNPR